MSNLVIQSTGSPFDRIRKTRPDGSEYWSARDLMPLMGYGADWRNFDAAVERAKLAARNQGFAVDRLFGGITENPSERGGRPRADYHMSRFAAYLVAMNGDPRKPEAAAAQAYFAVRTHEAEMQGSLPEIASLSSRDVLAIAQRLVDQEERAKRAESRVKELEPKAVYVDTYVADEDLIRFSTVASDLGIKASELRAQLIDAGWIYRETSTRWSESKGCKETQYRYSAYAHKKPYFRPVLTHDTPRFKGEVMHTLKITPAGAEAIARLVRRHARAAAKEIAS